MKPKKQRRTATVPAAIGYFSVFLMLSGFGAWSVSTQISGAVIASGTVEVESERQVIQHPDGGVVGEILARDGMSVEAGDVLLRLDGTFFLSELAIVENELADIIAWTARLQAERDGLIEIGVPNPPVFDLVSDDTFAELLERQRSLFSARLASLERSHRQLDEQETQVARRIEGMEAQRLALQRQRALVVEELVDLEALFARGLVQGTRLTEFRREDARLEGEIGNLTAMIAEANVHIAELAIEKSRLLDQRREDALTHLRELNFQRMELEERRLSLRERISRLDVRAPVPGIIFASSIAAERSVVRAAEPIMYIIPSGQALQVAAWVSPTDIDQVYSGQDVTLMFTSFHQQTMPEIPGTVLSVSADAETDEMSGSTYYEAIILPDENALQQIPNLRLIPGMPVESFIKTEERTPLSYLTQPLTVYFQRAFRGE